MSGLCVCLSKAPLQQQQQHYVCRDFIVQIIVSQQPVVLGDKVRFITAVVVVVVVVVVVAIVVVSRVD